jgi:hypothetical protein
MGSSPMRCATAPPGATGCYLTRTHFANSMGVEEAAPERNHTFCLRLLPRSAGLSCGDEHDTNRCS